MLSWLTDSTECKEHPVFECAEKQARQLRHNFIGSEHLIIGVLACGGESNTFLKNHGMSEKAAFEAVKKIVGEGEAPLRSKSIPYTPRAKRIYSAAKKVARSRSCPKVGWQHILIGILNEGDGIGAYILRDFDVEPDDLLEKLEDTSGNP